MAIGHQVGSIWRKWDLHVHVPDTHLNNGYEKVEDQVDLDLFCRVIHESTVSAVGLTDYFSLDGFFRVKDRYEELLHNGTLEGNATVLFPNLELRLTESVNTSAELVDYHLIFPPTLQKEEADEFLTYLRTEISDEKGKRISCRDLAADWQFRTATVTRDAIRRAITDTYGETAVRFDHVILISPVNGNGLRADAGNQRKRLISDEIDKFSDGFFGNQASLAHFLSNCRYDYTDQASLPKPVFAGSDCHSFSDLENFLGKEVKGTSNEKNVTWIKADLTFAGLQQAFIEPSERVRMQGEQPDHKEPYMYISSVQFEGTEDFPSQVDFNPNLNAIIGSRSSGKSALLAHVAHAADSEHTEEQQLASGMSESDLGPAASYLWSHLGDLNCAVEWGDGVAREGKVIYIPQNSLFSISTRPDEITKRIKPAVFRINPHLKTVYDEGLEEINNINSGIRELIDEWFETTNLEAEFADQLRDLGDKEAIQALVADLESEIADLQKESDLSKDESRRFDILSQQLGAHKQRIEKTVEAKQGVARYVDVTDDGVISSKSISATLTTTPESRHFSGDLEDEFNRLISELEQDATKRIATFVEESWNKFDSEAKSAETQVSTLESDNAALISKHDKAQGIAAPMERLEKQRGVLREIAATEEKLAKQSGERSRVAAEISKAIDNRTNVIERLKDDFNEAVVGLEDINFVLEAGLVDETLEALALDFNKQAESRYLDIDRRAVNLAAVRRDCSEFLSDVTIGVQRLRKNVTPEQIAHTLLESTEDIRFVAEMDDDRIGGFEKSSMTPGKQALFALRLILGESEDPWPLLLDQPEDDLDSRSIYDIIVEELKTRKRERQIIMVTHDANLVVGADAEAVIVANRHGSDHPNVREQTFDYITGALENSHRIEASHALARAGIREHACEILDGGEDAFQKRKLKYKI